MNEEGGGAGVIGIDAQGGFGAIGGAALDASSRRRAGTMGLDEICFVVGKMALEDSGDALETHAGVDGRLGQRREFAVGRAVELHEDEVPNFDEAATAIERKGFVLATFFGSVFAEIVMNFGAGTAGAGFAHLPEVIFFVEAEDAVFGHAGDFLPEISASSSSRKTVT